MEYLGRFIDADRAGEQVALHLRPEGGLHQVHRELQGGNEKAGRLLRRHLRRAFDAGQVEYDVLPLAHFDAIAEITQVTGDETNAFGRPCWVVEGGDLDLRASL